MNGPMSLRGTWIHARVAVHLACWISAEWASEVTKLIVCAAQRQIDSSGDSAIYVSMLKSVEREGTREQDLSGYVYAVTAPYYNAVKLGFWTKPIELLCDRYKVLLTTDMTIVTGSVMDARSAEARLLVHFEKHRIQGEVFDKGHWEDYVKYIETL
jgi:hypothetical protein